MDNWWKNFIRLVVVFFLVVLTALVLLFVKVSNPTYFGLETRNTYKPPKTKFYGGKVYVLKTMSSRMADACVRIDWTRRGFKDYNAFCEYLYRIPGPMRRYIKEFQPIGYDRDNQLFRIGIKYLDEDEELVRATFAWPIEYYSWRRDDVAHFDTHVSKVDHKGVHQDDKETDPMWEFVITNYGEDIFGVWVEMGYEEEVK